jgi:hypothetical protein
MFLLDNLLLGPSKAAMLVLRELAKKAQAEWLDDDAVKQQLQDIYAMVEAGKITTQEFEAMECQLLERLEQIAKAKYQDKWGAAEPAGTTLPPLDDQARVEISHSIQPLFPFETIDVTPTAACASAAEAPILLEAPAVLPAPAAIPDRSGFEVPELPQLSSPEPVPRPVSPAEPPMAWPAAPAYAPPPPFAPSPTYATPPSQPSAAYMPAPHAPSYMPSPAPPAMPVSLLSIPQVIESTSRAVALLNRKVSAITSVMPSEDGWRVTVEMVERRGVPDTADLLGVYELRLDPLGNVTRYERTRIRRRCDISR